MDLEEVQVAAYLRGHPDFVQEWLERNADLKLLEAVNKKLRPQEAEVEQRDDQSLVVGNESLKKALELSSLNVKYSEEPLENQASEAELEDDTLQCEPSPSVVPRTGRKSVTSDLFHQWLASGSSSRNQVVSWDSQEGLYSLLLHA